MKKISMEEFNNLRNDFNNEYDSLFKNNNYLYLFDVLMTDTGFSVQDEKDNQPFILFKFNGTDNYEDLDTIDEIFNTYKSILNFCDNWSNKVKDLVIDVMMGLN